MIDTTGTLDGGMVSLLMGPGAAERVIHIGVGAGANGDGGPGGGISCVPQQNQTAEQFVKSPLHINPDDCELLEQKMPLTAM